MAISVILSATSGAGCAITVGLKVTTPIIAILAVTSVVFLLAFAFAFCSYHQDVGPIASPRCAMDLISAVDDLGVAGQEYKREVARLMREQGQLYQYQPMALLEAARKHASLVLKQGH